MSKCRLRSYALIPPGGYPYVQNDGKHRVFPTVPVIEDQARIVADFRKANGLPRGTVREALEDVDRFQCQRLGGMSAFCFCSDTAPATVALGTQSPIISPCAGCGAKV